MKQNTYRYSYQVKYPDGKTTTSTTEIAADTWVDAERDVWRWLKTTYPDATIQSCVCINAWENEEPQK